MASPCYCEQSNGFSKRARCEAILLYDGRHCKNSLFQHEATWFRSPALLFALTGCYLPLRLL